MRRFVLLALVAIAASGCSYSRQIHRKSNLMSYLYPSTTEAPRAAGGNVRLQLPLRIGVAFVPSDISSVRYIQPVATLPPDGEQRLIEIVRKAFQGRDWVSEIITIPSSYLTIRGGFENLQQVGQLMNVDVIALVSVDQLQTSDPRRSSFLYISVIGAYVLPLDKNETRTLIDLAVFHVPSRTFLLRAPGLSTITGSSTAYDIEAKLRERSLTGFEYAAKDLSKNLDAEVANFKTSIASGERKDLDIYTAKGESVRGGGAFGFLYALSGLVYLILARRLS